MKNLARLTFSTVLLFSLFALSDSGIFGSWKFPPIQSGAFTFQIHVKFDPTSVTMTNECQSPYGKGVATATASATYMDLGHNSGVISIVGGSSGGNQACSINIAGVAMNYELSADGKTLTLSQANQTLTVTRE